MRGVGVVLIILGMISWASASVAFWVDATYDYIGTGYWCGSVFFIAGVIACDAGRRRMDSSIFWCVFGGFATLACAGVQFGFGVAAAVEDADDNNYDYFYEYGWRLAADITLCICGGLAFFLAIPVTIYSTKAVCSAASAVNASDNQDIPMQTNYYVNSGQTTTVITSR